MFSVAGFQFSVFGLSLLLVPFSCVIIVSRFLEQFSYLLCFDWTMSFFLSGTDKRWTDRLARSSVLPLVPNPAFISLISNVEARRASAVAQSTVIIQQLSLRVVHTCLIWDHRWTVTFRHTIVFRDRDRGWCCLGQASVRYDGYTGVCPPSIDLVA